MSIIDLSNSIISYLEKNQSATTEQIALAFDVSPSTVRRRFAELQQKGLIKRKRGVARLNSENNFTTSFTFRKHQNSLEKKRIALEAIKLIKNGDVIFLDGSSSVYFIAQYLDQFEGIKVFTNGIDTLSQLSQSNINAYSTGGMVSKINNAVLIGNFAEQTISGIHADICFFSALAVDNEGNVWDRSEEENALRKLMIANCEKSVFLCDSSKVGSTSSFAIDNLKKFDFMVCDSDITASVKTGGCRVIVCPT